MFCFKNNQFETERQVFKSEFCSLSFLTGFLIQKDSVIYLFDGWLVWSVDYVTAEPS